MRMPDFEALRFALEAHERIDIRLLNNAATWCCKAPHLLTDDALQFMAILVERVGPQVRLQQGLRNLAIMRKLRNVDTFHTTLSAERGAIAQAENISADRVAKIQRGQCADPALAAFVRSVRRGRRPLPAEVDAARQMIGALTCRLIGKGAKAEELRAKIATGFGAIGDSELQEELVLEVHAMVVQGTPAQDAIEAVAAANGQKVGALKSAYFRFQRTALRDLDDAVCTANRGNLMKDDATGAVMGFVGPTVSRQDVEERHKLGLDGFR